MTVAYESPGQRADRIGREIAEQNTWLTLLYEDGDVEGAKKLDAEIVTRLRKEWVPAMRAAGRMRTNGDQIP